MNTSADFFAAINAWVCDGYSLNITYLALRNTEGAMRLLRLAVGAGPAQINEAFNFQIRTDRIAAGQIVLNHATCQQIADALHAAVFGKVTVHGETFQFASRQVSFESDLEDTVRWEYDLHLRVNAPLTEGCRFDVPGIDRELRTVTPPFDGLYDLTVWLSLEDKIAPTHFAKAELLVKPPVDMLIDRTALRDDKLRVQLVAHPGLDMSALRLAVRAAPGVAVETRRQVAHEITWSDGEDGLRQGTAEIVLKNADSALLMLSLGDKTVRRQWFLDPVKARNTRLFAAKHFDPDFQQLRRVLLEDRDSRRFEAGIAALAFLLGFAPAVQVETQAPDLLVATPAGKLSLVECTFKVADFATKLGKLVDRRNALQGELARAGHVAQLYAILICRVPHEQLVFDPAELAHHKVILMTQANIEGGLTRVNAHNDPDELLEMWSNQQGSTP